MRGFLSQNEINSVWRAEWEKERGTPAKKVLGSRLSVESYKVVRRHVPADITSILEIGAGSGRFSVRFGLDFPRAEVVATDILDESLTGIERLKNELGASNVRVKKEDVLGLSFPDNQFDLVFSDAVIQHLNHDSQQKAVSEMARVLKPGGRLIISTVNFWNPHTFSKWLQNTFGRGYFYGYEKSYTAEELRKLLRNAGLQFKAEDGFYPAYGIVRLKRKHPIFGPVGKICDKATRLLDKLTGRFVSKKFGFERIIVGEKV